MSGGEPLPKSWPESSSQAPEAIRWALIKQIYSVAVEMDPNARSLYIADVCGDDLELRDELESLFAAEEEAGSFLNTPAVALLGPIDFGELAGCLEIGTVLSQRFRIHRFLGKGGMGEVYEAHDLEINTDVALKTLRNEIASDLEALARFKNEIALTRRITHPNVCRTFDIAHHRNDTMENGTLGEIVYITMELLDGITLAEQLRSNRLTPEQALPILTQIADALNAIHRVGVIHRDLKPGNVMLCQPEVPDDFGTAKRAVVTDFGLAQPEKAAQGSVYPTRIVGTPAYMAPERLNGEPATVATDIYALGVIIFEMLSGEKPSRELIHLQEDRSGSTAISIPIGRSIDPAWTSVVQRCLEPDPTKRFASAKQVIEALEAAGNRPTVRHALTRKGRRPDDDSQARERMKSAVLALAVLLPLAAVTVALMPTAFHNLIYPRHMQSLILTDIVNNTGNPNLNGSIKEFLATSLEESPYLKLFPPSKLPDVLTRMNLSSSETITALRGLEICKREGLDAEITTSINRFGSTYVMVLKALDSDGDEIITDLERSDDAEHIPVMVEKGARRLRSALGEDHKSVSRYSPPLEQVTSPSLVALTSYSEGKRMLYDGDIEDAVRLFERAVEVDPMFAMAYEYLGICYNIVNDSERAEINYLHAIKLSQHVTERERLKILGDYYLQIQDFSKAFVYLKNLVDEYPLDAPAHVNLGQAYLSTYRYQQALSETKIALSLQSSVGTLDNAAEIYFLEGDLHSSIGLTRQVLLTHPGDTRAIYNLARCYLVEHKFEDSMKTFDKLIAIGGTVGAKGRLGRADAEMAQGKFSDAERQLSIAIELEHAADNAFAESQMILGLASLYLEQGNRDMFTSQMARLPKPHSPVIVFLAGCLEARAHRAAKAERLLKSLNWPGETTRIAKVQSYILLLRAEIQMAGGYALPATASAMKALEIDDSMLGHEILARAYRAAGKQKEGIQEYERVLARSAQRMEECDGLAFHRVVEASYWLAALNEETGNLELSGKYLKAFLSDWSHPDGNAPLVHDGRSMQKRIQRVPVGRAAPAT
jgi:serine/threonine protein kinase/tetratricopeptide (TPR) repeat protein